MVFHHDGKGEILRPTPEKITGLETTITESPSKAQSFLLKKIADYQVNVGPRIKAEIGREDICRYTPTCSEYAKEAVEKHGALKGAAMAVTRLARCNPLSEGGYDPIR